MNVGILVFIISSYNLARVGSPPLQPFFFDNCLLYYCDSFKAINYNDSYVPMKFLRFSNTNCTNSRRTTGYRWRQQGLQCHKRRSSQKENTRDIHLEYFLLEITVHAMHVFAMSHPNTKRQ